MIPQEGRDLINLHLNNARTADVEAFADRNLNDAGAMLGFALACGFLSPVEHANEWIMIKLVRAERANARRRKELSHA